MKQEILQLIDILGTVSFAISGVFAAMKSKLDLLGILIISFITAIGGGTIRDMLIGDTPVNWMRGLNYPIIIFAAAVVTILFRNIIRNFENTLFVFDALGLGLFTVVGIQKGILFGLHPGICIMLGMITGSFGGVIRDTMLGTIPLIFRGGVLYATASIIGGLVFFSLTALHFQPQWIDMIAISFIFLIRIAAVRYKLSLPSFGYKDDQR